MVTDNVSTCPNCGAILNEHGRVRRIVKTDGGNAQWIKIRRLLCNGCGSIHRELPSYILPYKHYEARIIRGVVDGVITPYDLDYEDYPCETTMKRWKKAHEDFTPL